MSIIFVLMARYPMENSAKICFNRRYIAVKEMNTMGRFVNPGNSAFKVALASEIYIDKTGLLDFTNSVLGTKQAYIYVIAGREGLASLLRPICLQHITARAVIPENYL